MIYVHRDWTKIPEAKLSALKSLAAQLDELTGPEERKSFIQANQNAWSEVRSELSAMSFNKCWYTEARESVSRYQTDHFRPHGRAKQAERLFAAGYSWLAFDIQNYRIVGVLANTQNQEYAEVTVGKGDWFPLEDADARATLAQRDVGAETPILLDPTETEDVDLIVFNDNGEAAPRPELGIEAQRRISQAIRLMGISQDQLNRARRHKWRDCSRTIAKYERFIRKPKGSRTPEEVATIKELAEELITMASARSEFSAAVRCCLESRRLNMFVTRDEITPLQLPE